MYFLKGQVHSLGDRGQHGLQTALLSLKKTKKTLP